MTAQQALQLELARKLSEARIRNPGYSLRALARRLHISPATMSLLLNGRRSASPKLARRLVDQLGLSPSRSEEILARFATRRRRFASGTVAPRREPRLELTMDHYHIVSEWQHFGLRNLLRTEECVRDAEATRPERLASRLGITTAQAANAIDRLLRLGMIERREDGGLRATEQSFDSSDGVPCASIRQNHAMHLELARESLERDSVAIRDFTNLTMAINPARLDEARAAIRRCRDEIEALLEDKNGARTEVYSLAIQLFPLTKITE